MNNVLTTITQNRAYEVAEHYLKLAHLGAGSGAASIIAGIALEIIFFSHPRYVFSGLPSKLSLLSIGVWTAYKTAGADSQKNYETLSFFIGQGGVAIAYGIEKEYTSLVAVAFIGAKYLIEKRKKHQPQQKILLEDLADIERKELENERIKMEITGFKYVVEKIFIQTCKEKHSSIKACQIIYLALQKRQEELRKTKRAFPSYQEKAALLQKKQSAREDAVRESNHSLDLKRGIFYPKILPEEIAKQQAEAKERFLKSSCLHKIYKYQKQLLSQFVHDLFKEFNASENPDTKLKRIAPFLDEYSKTEEDIKVFTNQACHCAQKDAAYLGHDL